MDNKDYFKFVHEIQFDSLMKYFESILDFFPFLTTSCETSNQERATHAGGSGCSGERRWTGPARQQLCRCHLTERQVVFFFNLVLRKRPDIGGTGAMRRG